MAKKKSGGILNNKLFLGAGVLVLIVLASFFIFSGSEKYNKEDVEVFAQCLTENGAVMFGAFWCPHCADTKKKFGESFRFINYVECDPNGEDEQAEFCIEKGIDKYDTWEFADGSRLISEPTFEQLSEKTGCPIPEAKK